MRIRRGWIQADIWGYNFAIIIMFFLNFVCHSQSLKMEASIRPRKNSRPMAGMEAQGSCLQTRGSWWAGSWDILLLHLLPYRWPQQGPLVKAGQEYCSWCAWDKCDFELKAGNWVMSLLNVWNWCCSYTKGVSVVLCPKHKEVVLFLHTS